LYDDGTEVNTLKESPNEFLLYKYKKECGKPYHRINVFICEAFDFAKVSLGKCLNISDSDCEYDDDIHAVPRPSGINIDDLDNTTSKLQQDKEMAKALQTELDKELSSGIYDEADVRRSLNENGITDGLNSFYIVIRRGAPLEQIISIWQRVFRSVTPPHELRVKFVGEDGIDTHMGY